MSYSILRLSKVKGSNNTKGIQKHCQRENKNYQNPDINSMMTQFNYDLINDKQINYNQTIDEKIDANYSGNRKIRSDAIRHVDGIITSDSDFFKGLTPREERQFFKDSLEFLKEEYGEENMVYATVHVDEKTPHMHFGFVPLTDDGRLSAKEKLGNKKAMTELQDRFNSFIKEQGHDLERGISKSLTQAEHKQMETLKKETDYHENQLKEIQEKYKKIDSELDELVSNYHESVQLLDENIEIDYDNETEKVRNFMGRVTDEFETGRIVMNKTDFDKMKKMVETGTQSANLLERFQEGDMYQDNQELKKEVDRYSSIVQSWKSAHHEELDKNDKLQKENEELKSENAMWKANNSQVVDSLASLYKIARKNFEEFEEGFDAVSRKLSENEKAKPVSDFMLSIQAKVHEDDRKHEKRRSRSADRGLEL